MQNDFIYTHIRKISIYNTIISFAGFGIILALAFYIPFSDILYPVQMSYANSASTVYGSDVEYVEVTLNNAHYTGYDCYRRGKVYASYYYSLINNSCTLILVKNDQHKKLPEVLENYTIKARLIENSKLTEKVISGMSADLDWTKEGLKSVTSAVTIDETEYHLDIYFYLAICLGTIALILISFIIANVIYAIFPALYPACIYFKRLSGRENKIMHVNRELSSGIIFKSGNIILTDNYIISTSSFNIEIIPINKIIWAYEHSTWHHFLWFKTKLTYNLNLLCKHRIHAYFPRNTKEDIETVLNYLLSKSPDIILGYTKENQKLALKKCSRFKKKKTVSTKYEHSPKKR